MANVEIEEALAAGNVVISPFCRAQLGTVSYDVSLGYEVAYYTAVQGEFQHYVLREDEPLYLHPNQRVLARTQEAVGGLSFAGGAITTTMHAKSTAGRLGLQVCGCAGFGDVGYVAPWVLELHNLSPGILELPPRAVIAQIAFHRTGPILPGSSYGQTGSYSAAEADWSLFKHGLPRSLRSAPEASDKGWS
jgi:dCTP deaminase